MKLRQISMTGEIRQPVSRRAFTLLEMIIAIAVFMLVSVGISSIYINIIQSQRDVFISQDIQESLRFAAETMSKELRTAQLNDPASDWNIFTESEHFNQSGTENVYFKDQDGKLIHYFLQGGRLMKEVKSDATLAVTPEDVEITSLRFTIYEDGSQPMLSFSISARSRLDPTAETVIQTAISSRDYE